MQDPRVHQHLLKAIALCSHPSRPLRLLPSVLVIKRSYEWIQRRQHQDIIEAQLMVTEAHLLQQERSQMALEDRRIHFRKYYEKVLLEFKKKLQKEQAIRDKRELEEARIRKIREETRNLIES